MPARWPAVAISPFTETEEDLGAIASDVTALGADITSVQADAAGHVKKTGDTMTGRLLVPSGTAVAPSPAFSTDFDTGPYRVGANEYGISVGGTVRLRVRTTGSGQVLVPDGTVTNPGQAFMGDGDTGVLLSSANILGIAAAGTLSVQFVNNGVRAISGSAGTPSIAGASHTTTGFYWTTNTLGIAGGGAEAARFLSNNVFLTGAKDNTTGSTANTLIQASDGRIFRSTSARKYKSRINYNTDYLADVELKPAKFYRKDDKAWYIGFIADDLADENKLLGVYEDDEIENYDLRSVVAVLAAKIKRLEAETA